VSWSRRRVAGTSPQRPRFVPSAISVGHMMDAVAIRQFFLQLDLVRVPCQCRPTNAPYLFIQPSETLCIRVATTRLRQDVSKNNTMVSIIISRYTDHMRFAAYMAVWFITVFHILLVLFCIIMYMVVCFVCFCLNVNFQDTQA
jgi:hypothetical protein